MSYRATSSIKLEILDQILPEYTSAAKLSDPNYTGRESLYKSIDSRTGDIYLIVDPRNWREEKNLDGTITRFRPKPRLVMTYAKALETAAKTTAEDRLSAKKERMF